MGFNTPLTQTGKIMLIVYALVYVLELLAEDRRLREFFRNNRLLMLPLEQEVEFLRQAADRMGRTYAATRKLMSRALTRFHAEFAAGVDRVEG